MMTHNTANSYRLFRMLPLALASAVLLSACSGAADRFPSLAVRDVERMVGEFTPSGVAEPLPTPQTPPATVQTLTDVVESARDLHARFLEAQPGAMALARRAQGAATASDLRSQALVALADQSILRTRTASALATIDALEAEAASTYGATDDIRAAQTRVLGLITEQDAALDSLSAAMR